MKKKKKKLKTIYKIRRILWSIFIIVFVFLLVLNNSNISSKKNDIIKKEIINKDKKLSLVMVGDALIHGAIYNDAKVDGNYNFKPMLSNIKKYIKKYDLAYYNQETILGGKELGLSTYPRFNSPYEVGDAFLDAGFNLVSLANNHTLDKGKQAIINSCAYWKNKNVYVSGSYCSMEDRNYVKIYEKNGIKYALLSYTTVTNGLKVPDGDSFYLNIYNEEQVKKDIELYRDKTDLLMVAMHFGVEYTHEAVKSQKEIANYLSSLGVDIVIGTHPHVVEPIEFINNTLVIYSLGNFISAQNGIEKLSGLMVSADIIKSVKTNKITINNVKADLVYTYSDEKKGYRGNFKVYPYSELNDNILNNYKEYYDTYISKAILEESDLIKKGDLSGNIK